jgi:1-deoxy-D-xylulose-5-phosphate synthase
MAEKNNKITAITAAMPDGTGLLDFYEKFPKRFFDVGIAEQHAVTFSAGLAIEGFIPFVAIYSTFLQRAYDQVIHDVCLDGHHVVFAMDRAGIVGEDGPTHHGAFDISYLRPVPNITIMAPSSGDELVRMMKTAESMNSPVAIRYPRGSSENENFISYDEAEIISPLKASLLKDGSDILIVAIGSMVSPAQKACSILEEKGYRPSLIDARFAKPLDEELICSMSEKTDKIITVEENVLNGGFGTAVLELFADKGIINKKIIRMGINDEFVTQGTPDELKNIYGLNSEGILKNALKLLENDK